MIEDYLLQEFHDVGLFLPGETRGHGVDEHGERLRCNQCGYLYCSCGTVGFELEAIARAERQAEEGDFVTAREYFDGLRDRITARYAKRD